MRFLKQDCTLTLRQGLEELYSNHPEVKIRSKRKGESPRLSRRLYSLRG